MFSQTFLPYMTATSAIDLGSETKNSLIAVAVASAVAASMDMPTARIGGVEEHFTSNYQSQAFSLLSNFNEASIFNIRMAKDLVRKFWLYRYYTVFETGMFMPASEKASFFEAITQVGRFFSPDEINLMNEHVSLLCSLRQTVSTVIASRLSSEV